MTPCILIPCYNHAGPLAAVLARLAEYGLPCLLIDDGSEPVALPRSLRRVEQMPVNAQGKRPWPQLKELFDEPLG